MLLRHRPEPLLALQLREIETRAQRGRRISSGSSAAPLLLPQVLVLEKGSGFGDSQMAELATALREVSFFARTQVLKALHA